MNLNREENYKYRKLGLTVLSKALDDICPKFEGETDKVKKQLIKERIQVFKVNERELDKEWKELEKEVEYELNQFTKSREQILKKIERTRKTKRIASKIKELEHKKELRMEYLLQKQADTINHLQTQLKTLNKTSKKYGQIDRKLKNFLETTKFKIKKTEFRFNTIIQNTLNSDNSEKVDERLAHSKEVWDRKYEKLKHKFLEKEMIYENKRMELDQIRLSIQAFEEELPTISHWCLIAGVSLKECYLSVNARLEMIGRKSKTIDSIIEKISYDGDPKPL